MHTITEVTIRNFRSCKEVTVPLSDFTPIVGCNNAGKSNIIRALEWLVNRGSLAGADFYDSAEPLSVEATIIGIDAQVLERLGVHRARVEPHVVNGEIRIRTFQAKPGATKKEISQQIWQSAKTPPDWGNPSGLNEALTALFPEPIHIEAMEDAGADLSKSQKASTIGKLIAEIMGPLEKQHGTSIQKALNEVRSLLAEDGEQRADVLNEFDEKATRAMEQFFPGMRLKIEVEPPAISEIFKSGKIKMADVSIPGETEWREVSSHGHGAQRSAQMALIQMLAERGGVDDGGRKLLLIDEPELYLHPPMIEQVRLALKRLSQGHYQVIFSTHSPILVHREEVGNTVMVDKDGTGTSIKQAAHSCCSIMEQHESQTELLLDLSHSSQWLFCRRVVLVEGKTEKTLISLLVEKVLGRSLLSDKTALLPLNGCGGAKGTRRVLDALGFQQKAILDLDVALGDGKVLIGLKSSDELFQECLKRFASLATTHGFKLNGNGLPQKGGKLNAEQAFEEFARDADGAILVQTLHKRFKAEGIWLWPKGAIEAHLGMSDKGGDAIREFQKQLLVPGAKPEKVISDYAGIREALEWVLR